MCDVFDPHGQSQVVSIHIIELEGGLAFCFMVHTWGFGTWVPMWGGGAREVLCCIHVGSTVYPL